MYNSKPFIEGEDSNKSDRSLSTLSYTYALEMLFIGT